MKCSISLAGRGIQKMGLLIFFVAVFAMFFAQPLSAREYDMRKAPVNMQNTVSPAGDEDPSAEVKNMTVEKKQTPLSISESKQNFARKAWLHFIEVIHDEISSLFVIDRVTDAAASSSTTSN